MPIFLGADDLLTCTTMSEIDESHIVMPPWPWPVSLTDEDLESLQESHSPM